MAKFGKSDMKNLGEQKGFKIYELGDLFYFLLPTVETNRVIISSHGGHQLIGGTNKFVVPSDTILRFYSEDTYSVKDPSFNGFYDMEAAPKEVISEGEKCFDYILTKYQGRHNTLKGNKETYDTIAGVVNQAVEDNLNAQRRRRKDWQAASKVSAVLTVRNRFFKGTAHLSKAIEAVHVIAPHIQLFDCLFCRSTMFGGSQGVNLIARGAPRK
eukprot:gene12892-12991_t